MASINGDVNKEIFMKQAEKFVEGENETFLSLLKKSQYGLKLRV